MSYESIGNTVEIIGSEELRKVHPLGKLPAAIIDGRPLFESAAIVTAVADLVPERNLIARPGTWSRNLHYQWMSFALSEMEAFLQSSEVNRLEFLLPSEQHVPGIIEQNERLFKKGAAALDEFLAKPTISSTIGFQSPMSSSAIPSAGARKTACWASFPTCNATSIVCQSASTAP